MKNGLAQWIKEINVENVLRNLGEVMDEDVTILLEHFPRSRFLRKYRK